MPPTQIRINKTKELSDVLQMLRDQYLLLNDAELVKLSLSMMYALSQKQTQMLWTVSLPVTTLSEKEQVSLSQGLKGLKKQQGQSMTADQVMQAMAKNY